MKAENKPLDFSAFDYKPSFSDLKQPIIKKLNSQKIVVLAVLFIVIFFLAPLAWGLPGEPASMLFALLPLILISLFLGIVAINLINEIKSTMCLKRFATSNGFNFKELGTIRERIGIIFNKGHSEKLGPYISGIYRGRPFEVYKYEYVIGSGKNRKTHKFTVFSTKLSRTLPNILMDSKSNNFVSILSNLPSTEGNQKLTLEGDFNKYYNVTIPKGYGRDALYFLTPELMSLLVDHAAHFDVEVIEKNLMFYTSNAPLNKDILRDGLSMLSTVGDEFNENTIRYADERVGDAQADVVAKEGRLLKSGISKFSIIVFAIYLMYIILNFLSGLWQ